MYSIINWHLCVLRHAHHQKSSFHSLPYNWAPLSVSSTLYPHSPLVITSLLYASLSLLLFCFCLLKNMFYWLCYYSCSIPTPEPLWPAPSLSPAFPPCLSSCPWVVHINSLASPFPILFLISPCLFCTYQFVLLNPCAFSPILLPFLPRW